MFLIFKLESRRLIRVMGSCSRHFQGTYNILMRDKCLIEMGFLSVLYTYAKRKMKPKVKRGIPSHKLKFHKLD